MLLKGLTSYSTSMEAVASYFWLLEELWQLPYGASERGAPHK